MSIAAVIVYIELGLTIPRWPFGPNGEKISTPRSGEAVNSVLGRPYLGLSGLLPRFLRHHLLEASVRYVSCKCRIFPCDMRIEKHQLDTL